MYVRSIERRLPLISAVKEQVGLARARALCRFAIGRNLSIADQEFNDRVGDSESSVT